jgi:hypothetical protein
VSSLHNKPVVAGADTFAGSDAVSAPTPATTPTAAPEATARPVEQPDAGPVPPTGPASTFDPQAARDAAAYVAYPPSRHNTRETERWINTPTLTTVIGDRDTTPKIDTGWMSHGACYGLTDYMFPGDRPGAASRKRLIEYIDEAVAICRTCPVTHLCAQWAEIERPVAGVYAGRVWNRGRPLADRLQGVPPGVIDQIKSPSVKNPNITGRKPEPIRHGTLTGAWQHWKRQIPLCDECRAARLEHSRQRRLKVVEDGAA